MRKNLFHWFFSHLVVYVLLNAFLCFIVRGSLFFYKLFYKRSLVISTLTMFVDVETFFLHTLVNANADGFIYNKEQNGCDNQSEHNAHARTYELHPQLMPVAIESAFNAAIACDILCCEDTCKD